MASAKLIEDWLISSLYAARVTWHSRVMIAIVPAAMRETIGIGDRGVALLMGGTYLGFLAGNLVVATTARRLDGLVLCSCGGALAACGVALMALCTLVSSGLLWATALLAYSIGHGLIFPAALGLIMQAMPTRAGMAAAVTLHDADAGRCR